MEIDGKAGLAQVRVGGTGVGHHQVRDCSASTSSAKIESFSFGEPGDRSPRHNIFTNGGVEQFDFAASGRLDCFVLGGMQIDGQANVNLVSTGEYRHPEMRFPGSFGSAFVYFVVPRVILFREEHSLRSLVIKVDFVSAPGTSPPGVYRPGGPTHLLTGRALFRFDRARALCVG